MRLRNFLLVPCFSTLLLAQGTSPSLMVTLVQPNHHFKVGEPIEIQVRLENTSEKSVWVPYSHSAQGNAEMTYAVDVLDGYGNRPARTKWGKRLRNEDDRGGIFNSIIKKNLKPGEIIADSVTITKIYDITQPGRYVVQVTYGSEIGTKNQVASKAIVVIVSSE